MGKLSFGIAMTLSNANKAEFARLSEAGAQSIELGLESGFPLLFSATLQEQIESLNLRVSFHLPFFLNAANRTLVKKSKQLLCEGLNVAGEFSSISVFHPGFPDVRSRSDAVGNIVLVLKETLESCTTNGRLGIENTAQNREIGNIDEILHIVEQVGDSKLVPVIDWAHLYAQNYGRYPTSEDHFREVLNKIGDINGECHFHISGIEHRNGQEVKHLSLSTCLPPIPFLLKVLEEEGQSATLILETPSPLDDLVWIRNILKDLPSGCKWAAQRLKENGAYTPPLTDFFS